MPLRIVALLGGIFAALLLSRYVFLNSPRIKTCRHQSTQFHAFCKAIKQAAGTLELQQILDSAARVIVEATGVLGCSIKLLSSKTGRMIAHTIVGIDKERSDQALEIVEDIYKKGSMARESVIVRDIRMRDFPAVDEGFESLICVPLYLEEKPLGAICIFGERGQSLSPGMLSLLTSLGDVVSLSIAHALTYENLKHLVQTKTKFMFQASHELRSPLNSIQSMARTLIDGYLGELSEEQLDMVSRIELRSQRLSEIVKDLLILAVGRAELATLKPEVLDLKDLLVKNLRFFETQVKEKRIELQFSNHVRDGLVSGNREGMTSVITNLLSNAIKYTPAGGRIAVSLFESREQMVIEVSDSGIGIPEEEQAELFTEFFRASNARKMEEIGTGLGLTIVKATVEQHGGSIDVISEKGKGTTFRIFLNKLHRKSPPGVDLHLPGM